MVSDSESTIGTVCDELLAFCRAMHRYPLISGTGHSETVDLAEALNPLIGYKERTGVGPWRCSMLLIRCACVILAELPRSRRTTPTLQEFGVLTDCWISWIHAGLSGSLESSLVRAIQNRKKPGIISVSSGHVEATRNWGSVLSNSPLGFQKSAFKTSISKKLTVSSKTWSQ